MPEARNAIVALAQLTDALLSARRPWQVSGTRPFEPLLECAVALLLTEEARADSGVYRIGAGQKSRPTRPHGGQDLVARARSMRMREPASLARLYELAGRSTDAASSESDAASQDTDHPDD